MRYEDASQTGSISELTARDDAEHLAGNDFGPATGNIITGTGTVSGATGTDIAGAGAQITAIAGAGGSDTSFDASGKLEVAGQYGTLTIDANGNYTYVRNPGSPDAVSDTFTYTLANSAGATDSANLVINIGNIPMLQAEGSQTVTTNNGVVVLPAGVELSDVRVVGRDLVITLPDGSTMVIPDGAIFVPQLVVDGVEVPASNLAALLIDSEPKPAAGDTGPTSPTSGGGNFGLPPGPLDPGVPLGDLIPPTELNYTPPEFEEIFPDEDNDPPFIGSSAVNVSEEGVNIIAAPIPDTAGSPDTTNSAVVGGVISVGDDDGDSVIVTLGTPSAALTSQGVPVTWSVSPDGHTLTGSAGANTVITLAINDAGIYTVTLVRPIDHPNAGGEQGSSFVVPVSANDGEESTTGGTITVTIEDDSPVVSNVTVQGGVTLDETTAGTPAGFPISGTTAGPVIVNSSGGFGADGPAVANATVYGIALTGGVSSLASGIVTAVGDFPITLVQIDGDTIQGQYTNGGTQVAFIVQMNANGTVTLTQNVALEHNNDGPPGPAHDDSLSLAGLVNATVTLTDRDGDVATGSAPIGGGLIFRDDGPDAQVSTQAVLDTIVLDETRPEGSDTAGGGAPTGDASATANFADNFILPADFGADGAGTVTYQLLLSANGIGSGLYALQPADTSAAGVDGDGIGQGAEITLSQTGNTITGSAGGTNYFTISIDANTGVVTFTQLNPIWHPTPGASFDEAAALNTAAAANIQVQQTVTDSDGDFDTATVNVGQGVFSIQDDGPNAAVDVNATLDSVVLDETRPAGTDTAGGDAPTGDASATLNFADNFVGGGDFGEDGPGSVSYQLLLSANGIASGLYALQPADTSAAGVDGDGIGQGAAIMLSQTGNTITGSAGGTDYFTISIDPATGVVTFTQLAAIWHPTPGASFDEAAALSTAAAANVQVQQTITDADGDTDTATVDIGQGVFSIQDDGPNAAVDVNATLDTVVLDETRPEGTDTAGGGAPTGDASATLNFADNFVGGGDFGEDGPGSVTYQLLLSANGIGSGLYALQPADTSAAGIDGDGIGQGAEITLSQVGDTITGSAGGTDYFTISIDANTGVVTFTQLNPIWHPTPGASFDEAAALNTAAAANVQVQQTITDADGDTDTATVNIGQGVFSIQDDGPNAEVNGQAALDTIVLDETRPEGSDTAGGGAPNGDASATANFADNFLGGGDYGEDGPGSVSYSLLLSANGIGSGLYALQPADTSAAGIDGDGIGQGAEITLSQVGNTITGSAGGIDYFTISIDSNTGVVTFTQLAPIWHPTPGASFDEVAVLNTAAAANVQVVQTVRDADGDTDTASINVGQGVFSIQDDGPDASLNTGATLDTLALDETRPEGTDTAGGGAPTGDASVTANFADNFTGPSDFGADGAGSVVYSLNLSANGIASGLFALEPADNSIADLDGYGQGASITLSKDPVTGVVTGSAGGVDYFTISINSGTGVVTFTQLAPIWHPTPGASYDEAAMLSTAAAANLQVVQTITDADGDVDSAAVNIGQGVFSIQDDGPSATNEAQRDVQEGNQTVTGTFDFDIGEDGGGVSHINGTLLTFGGDGWSQWIAVDDGQIRAQADGDYEFQTDSNGSGVTNGTFTVTDNDGDTASGTWAFNVTDANGPVAGSSNARLDDDGLAGGNPASTTGDIDANVGEVAVVNPSEAVFHGDLNAEFGGDGAGTINFAAMHNTFGQVGTERVVYTWDAGTRTLLAEVAATDGGGNPQARAGTDLFTVVLDGSFNGNYTLTLLDNVLHAPGGNETSAPNVPLTFTIIDSDNSPAGGVNGTLNIEFNDDAPTATVNGQAALDTIVLDETRPEGSDTAGGGAPTGDASATANFADNFTAPIAYGADGPGSTTYSLILSANGIASGLFALQPGDTTTGDTDGIGQGASIALNQDAITGVITGSAGGTDYFTISIDSNTGVVTFTQLNPIWHPTPGASFDEAAALNTAAATNIQVQQTVTDADGDVASATVNVGQGVFSIQDDGPNAEVNGQAALDTIVLDETRPEGQDTAGVAPNGLASSTAAFADNFAAVIDYGADGPGSVVYSLNLSDNGISSGLYALDPSDILIDGDGYGQGASITLSQDAITGVVTGSAGGTDYFTISINSGTGVVTFTQLAPIWHPTPGTASFDEAATLTTADAASLQVVQTITDADGDVDSAAVNVGQNVFSIQDDGPQAIQPEAATLNNEIGGSDTADLDDDTPSEVITDFGEDGPGLVRFANITNHMDSGYTSDDAIIRYYLANDGQTLLAKTGAAADGTGGTLIFTVQINQAAGTYTVTMAGTIDNGAGVNFDDLTSGAAGNVNYRGIGEDDEATTVDIILSASTATGTAEGVNTDSNSIGVGNQSIGVNQTVRIDFVTDLEVSTVTPATPMGFTHGGHVLTNSYLQTIAQVQGSQTETVAFQVYALDTNDTQANEPDRFPDGGFNNSDVIEITSVTVDGFDDGPLNQPPPNEPAVTLDISGIAVGVWTAVAYGISVQKQEDGSVIFTGVQEGDQYGIGTGVNDFNAVAVTVLPTGTGPNAANDSSEDDMDLGIFAIGQVDTGEPIDINFDLSITDADGDTIVMEDAIDITIEPAGTVQSQALPKDGGPDTMEVISSHSLLVSETQEVERVAANSNSVTLAAAVAAAGVTATSAAASVPGVQDGSQVTSLKAFGGPQVMSDLNIGDQSSGNVSGFSPLHGGGFEFGAETLASSSYNAIAASHFGELTAALSIGTGGPNALLEATDFSAALPAMTQSNAMSVAMPTVQSPAAVQGGVEQIIADALNGGGSAPSIDALLSALPGQGLGENAGLNGLATQIGDNVPNGDMGHGGVFTFDAATIITSEAMVLHHDAVQPVANG